MPVAIFVPAAIFVLAGFFVPAGYLVLAGIFVPAAKLLLAAIVVPVGIFVFRLFLLLYVPSQQLWSWRDVQLT